MKHTLRIEHIDLPRSRTFCLHLGKLRLTGGTILCIAGPNGSGKSTLLECLAGVLTGSSVNVSIDGTPIGTNIRATKAKIGYIPDDEQWFIPELSAAEYFLLLQTIYAELDIPLVKMQQRLRHMAQILQFSSYDQPLSSLSHGNKKKVQIIAGLMHQPSLLIVDELRNGLDPLAISAAEYIVRGEAARGACVITSTHDLAWAERVATQTLILVDGTVAVHADTETLLRDHGTLERLFVKLTRNEGC